jgi:prefoldin subunit 2
MSHAAAQTPQSTELLQQKYNNYQQTIAEIQAKVSELQNDEEEHKIVLQTLNKTPKDRRCFRMVGGALIEKNVGETVPVLDLKLSNITTTIDQLSKELRAIVEEFEKWKVCVVVKSGLYFILQVTNEIYRLRSISKSSRNNLDSNLRKYTEKIKKQYPISIFNFSYACILLFGFFVSFSGFIFSKDES